MKFNILVVHIIPSQALSLRDPVFKVDIYSGHEKHLSCPTSPEYNPFGQGKHDIVYC